MTPDETTSDAMTRDEQHPARHPQHTAHERTGQLAAGPGTDCSEALLRVYEYLDGEMGAADVEKIRTHLDECADCLRQYHLDQALKTVVKRSCSHEEAPLELRASILHRITMIRVSTGE